MAVVAAIGRAGVVAVTLVVTAVVGRSLRPVVQPQVLGVWGPVRRRDCFEVECVAGRQPAGVGKGRHEQRATGPAAQAPVILVTGVFGVLGTDPYVRVDPDRGLGSFRAVASKTFLVLLCLECGCWGGWGTGAVGVFGNPLVVVVG